MTDRRLDARSRAALDRLEAFRVLHPGGISYTEPFEGVRLGLVQQLVAALYADGRSRCGIAEAVGCSPATVRTHLDQIDARLRAAQVEGDERRVRIMGWVHRRRACAILGDLLTIET